VKDGVLGERRQTVKFSGFIAIARIFDANSEAALWIIKLQLDGEDHTLLQSCLALPAL